MDLTKGNTYSLKVNLKINNENIDYNDVQKIEFTLGSLKKTLEQFTTEENKLILELSQAETFKLEDNLEYQVRIKLKTGAVICSEIKNGNIKKCLSRTVL